MSTKYNDNYESKETVKCIICDGTFVPGGVRIELPDRVCLWCFTRGPLYRRMTLLWEAVQDYHADHAAGESSTCDCKGCKIYRVALPIMEPSARIQTSET